MRLELYMNAAKFSMPLRFSSSSVWWTHTLSRKIDLSSALGLHSWPKSSTSTNTTLPASAAQRPSCSPAGLTDTEVVAKTPFADATHAAKAATSAARAAGPALKCNNRTKNFLLREVDQLCEMKLSMPSTGSERSKSSALAGALEKTRAPRCSAVLTRVPRNSEGSCMLKRLTAVARHDLLPVEAIERAWPASPLPTPDWSLMYWLSACRT
mmetsp:Transcript_25403/g.76356  ORF Transcript_25403/g.76356 Transcript_25403/m.76356 type:complete len:211 (+) Transcript_25403:900-1532(+)